MAVNVADTLAFEQAVRHGHQEAGDGSQQAVTFTVPHPRQFPLPPTRMYGFGQELRELDGLHGAHRRRLRRAREVGDPATPPMAAVLTGPTGAGKSALAAYWLKHAVPLPVKQLRADFGPGDGQDKNPHDVIGRWLRDLDVPDTWIPASPAGRTEAWRSFTARQSIAILIEDVPDLRTLNTLLPGPGPAVVVATSSRIPGPSSGTISVIALRGLAAGDVHEMLRDDDGTQMFASPDTARHLLAVSAGRPLALRIAIRILSRSSTTGAAALAADVARALGGTISAGNDGTGVLRTLASIAHEYLDPPEAKAWRFLALHRGPDFSADLAAAALGCGPAPAARALAGLCRAGLLDRTGARYRYNGVLREVALAASRESETSETLRAVHERIAAYYLDRLTAAERLLPRRPGSGLRDAFPDTGLCQPELTTADDALAWMQRERANLLAVVRMAAEPRFRGRHPAGAAQLADASWPLWRYRGTADEQAAICRSAGDRRPSSISTQRGGPARDWEGVARLHDLAGLGLLRRHELAGALDQFTLGNQAWPRIDDHRGLVHLEHARGLVSDLNCHDADAVRHLANAICCYRQAGDDWQLARAVVDLAGPLLRLGSSPADALLALGSDTIVSQLHRAAAVLEADPYEQVLAWTTLGAALEASGEPAESRRFLEMALVRARLMAARPEEVRILALLAGQAEQSGDAQQAAALRGKARELIPAGIEAPRMTLDSRFPRADGTTCTG